jgi:hypothetical protein
VFNNILPENRAVYEIINKYTYIYIYIYICVCVCVCVCVYTGHKRQYDTAHAICMLDSRGYTHTHTLKICNTAFSHQQWLRERASMLFNTCTACLVHSFRDTVVQRFRHIFSTVQSMPQVTSVDRPA